MLGPMYTEPIQASGWICRPWSQTIPLPPDFNTVAVLPCSWFGILTYGTSLVAQWWGICLPRQEPQIWSLGGRDPLKEEMASTPVFLPGKSHGQRNLEGYSPWGHKRVRHALATKQQHSYLYYYMLYIHMTQLCHNAQGTNQLCLPYLYLPSVFPQL